jgi:TPR repeat protein
MYAKSLGVGQDDQAALKWFWLAAVHNDIKARCSLAMMPASDWGSQDIFKTKQSAAEEWEAGGGICKIVRDNNQLGIY